MRDDGSEKVDGRGGRNVIETRQEEREREGKGVPGANRK